MRQTCGWTDTALLMVKFKGAGFRVLNKARDGTYGPQLVTEDLTQ